MEDKTPLAQNPGITLFIGYVILFIFYSEIEGGYGFPELAASAFGSLIAVQIVPVLTSVIVTLFRKNFPFLLYTILSYSLLALGIFGMINYP
jgi:hypothetical protein